jgi:hypothetical protein
MANRDADELIAKLVNAPCGKKLKEVFGAAIFDNANTVFDRIRMSNARPMKLKNKPLFTRNKLLGSLLFAFISPAQAQSVEALAAQLNALREDLFQVRAELETLKKSKAVDQAPSLDPSLAPVLATAPAAAPTLASVPVQGASAALSPISLFGYGELNFVRPRGNASAAIATARRGVLGFGYRFNERTRMVAELEVENAVVSAGDQGEVAFEQLYIEHDINDRLSAKIGLFLMPVGYLNEVHEPTKYFGVTRNLIETAIIPSTWRELGVGFRGTLDNGLRWDAGLVTSFDLGKWDANSSDGKASPLGSIHQEGQLAKAASLAAYAALNYNGIPGLNLGGSLYHGGAGHRQAGFAAASSGITLTEVHARWQPGRWDLSALLANGRFSDVAALNSTFAGLATPVPNAFGGWYMQAAYKLWKQGDYSLVPFTRYERLNTAKGYSGLPPGFSPAIDPDTRVLTFGTSFYLNPQVVLKADFQRYLTNSSLDRFSLGVGFQY